MAETGEEANVSVKAQDKTDPPANEDVLGTSTDKLEKLESQLKGLQRANERLRRELTNSVQAEGNAEVLKTLSEAINSIGSSVAGVLDEETAAKVKQTLARTAQVQTALEAETGARSKIVDKLGAIDMEWEDDSLGAARAYYEDGNYDKAIGEVDKVISKQKDNTRELEVQVEVEKRLREAGHTIVQSSGGSAPKPPPLEGEEALRVKLQDKTIQDPREMLKELSKIRSG